MTLGNTLMNTNKELVLTVSPLFSQCIQASSGIELITLSTTDGFAVHTETIYSESFHEDKMAAAASTLYAVSNAVSKQILSRQFETTFIETQKGNIAFVSLSIKDSEYVLAMSADESLNIANLRLLIKRLAKDIHGSTQV